MTARQAATPVEPVLAAAVEYVARCQNRRSSAEAMTALAAAIEVSAPGALASAGRRLLEPRWSGQPPEWVRVLVRRHALGKVTELVWRRSQTKGYSSGHCGYGNRRIIITASWTHPPRPAGGWYVEPETAEQRVVVLHEITHALKTYHGHDEVFFDQFYVLLRAEGLYKAGLARASARSLRAAARRARGQARLTRLVADEA